MGLFSRKKETKTGGGGYSLSTLTAAEKNAVIQLFDLAMQGPVQAGIKGQALQNARCTGTYTYGQLEAVKKRVQAGSLSADDVRTVSFILTSGSAALIQLLMKLQREKVGGERLARAATLQANAGTAKKKVEAMLKQQSSSWESF